MTLNEPTTPEASQVAASQVAEQETPVAEDQTTEGEHQESSEQANSQDTKVETSQSEEGQQQHKEEQRPRRLERRFQQFLKNGKPENPFTNLLTAMPEPQPDEQGFYTPEQVRQMAAAEAAKVIQMEREVQSYQQEAEEYASEAEQVGLQLEKDFKENPDLMQKVNGILIQSLKAANLRTDETGRTFFVPIQRPKELYRQIKEALEMTSSAGTEKANAALAQQIAEGAITPTTGHSESETSLSSLKKELWSNPGKVVRELGQRLPRSD